MQPRGKDGLTDKQRAASKRGLAFAEEYARRCREEDEANEIDEDGYFPGIDKRLLDQLESDALGGVA